MSFYNYLIDHTEEPLTPITEPVTLAEAKNYCRVTTSVDDALITDLITQARESVEKATQLCLIPKTVTVWFNNTGGQFNFPYGPISFFLSLQTSDSNEINVGNYQLIGGPFPRLIFPAFSNMKATYQSGYDCVPKDLKTAILDQIDFDYENRGADIERYDQTGVCQKAWRACQRYTRTSPIL